VLDRLVGYQISPILWKKVRRGLSAGRVQSVAVRLIVEREEAIKAFVPWSTGPSTRSCPPSSPRASRPASAEDRRPKGGDQGPGHHRRARQGARGGRPSPSKVDRRERRRNPAAPFITSKLQQEAANRLYFSAKKTMTLAQRLYEGVELGEEGSVGLITYMRTDSTRLSNDAVDGARAVIGKPTARSTCRPSPTSSSRARRPRTPTRPSARPLWSGRPSGCAVPRARHVPALRAHLEPVPGLPDDPAVYDQTSSTSPRAGRSSAPPARSSSSPVTSRSMGPRPTRSRRSR
jgi:DNA topoisomerase I